MKKEKAGNFIFRKHWHYPSFEAGTESLYTVNENLPNF